MDQQYLLLAFAPPVSIRHTIRPSRSISRTTDLRVIRCNATNDGPRGDSKSAMARLLSMQQHIMKRRQKLQVEKPKNDSHTQTELAPETPTSQPQSPVPVPAPVSLVKPVKKVSNPVTRRASPLTFESQPHRVTIIRRDAHLPWKSSPNLTPKATSVDVLVPTMIDIIKSATYSRGNFLLPRYDGIFDLPSPPQTLIPSSAPTAVPDKITLESPQSQARNAASDLILSSLNAEQREAVTTDCTRACLVLAGPGSGKTRVLTHRIAYLINKHSVPPSAILAVTFTNKAAAEMKARVVKLLSEQVNDTEGNQANYFDSVLSVGTFHWICARLLRTYGSEISIDPDFQICDTSDVHAVLGRLLRRIEGVKVEASYVNRMASFISKLKNDKGKQMQDKLIPTFFRRIEECRIMYDKDLREMNFLDFDDLLVETRRMLRDCPNVLSQLQSRFTFVLVDEWQDTNNVQFDIVSLLSAKGKNLFAVGDVDQSIYKFRGADSGNIRRYTTAFSNANQVILSMNYRSTINIVEAAQAVIKENRNRPKKYMKTMNERGENVKMMAVADGKEEAQLVASSIYALLRKGHIKSFSDCAIMYRTNSQSRLLEEACVQSNIPYELQSGTRFFERKEVKDVLAFLKLMHNPTDSNACARIINVPPRGIGKRTVELVEEYAERNRLPMLAAIDCMLTNDPENDEILAEMNIRPVTLKKIEVFRKLMTILQNAMTEFKTSSIEKKEKDVGILLSFVAEQTGYTKYLHSERDEATIGKAKAQDRLDNIEELKRAASLFTDVLGLLERATLMSEKGAKTQPGESGFVRLMTLHGAKGLEFDTVFITGAEDGLIPLHRAATREGDEGIDLEEERRLLYVGMTRAKRMLNVTWRCQSRKGKDGNRPSRFLRSIPGMESKGVLNRP